jgi:hypothetical protein
MPIHLQQQQQHLPDSILIPMQMMKMMMQHPIDWQENWQPDGELMYSILWRLLQMVEVIVDDRILLVEVVVVAAAAAAWGVVLEVVTIVMMMMVVVMVVGGHHQHREQITMGIPISTTITISS